ncbi:MAG: hypothetical protein KBG40_09180 [Bacteroidales bacterium]|nr:hypothetical protein [Bacteroidales bacterium]
MLKIALQRKEVKNMSAVKKIIEAITILVSLVKVLVEVFEVPGYGPEKKQAVLDALSFIFDLIEEHWFKFPFSKELFLSVAGGLIEIFVGFFNKVDIFVHLDKAKE